MVIFQAEVKWDPAIRYWDAPSLDVLVKIGEEEHRAIWTRPFSVHTYLQHLIETVRLESKGEYQRLESSGKIEHTASINDENVISLLKLQAPRISKKYFMVTRNEWADDEQYTIFYSNMGFWVVNPSVYTPGDFAETLRQTAYDMDHVSAKVFLSTNVPRRWMLEKRMRSDPKFKEYAQTEILPQVNDYWRRLSKPPIDYELLKKTFIEIAQSYERYEASGSEILPKK